MIRRIAGLIGAATALAVIPVQAQAAKDPQCLARKAKVFAGNGKTFSFDYDTVAIVKGNNNQVQVKTPPAGGSPDKSYICVEGKSNNLRGTFYRAYSKPGKDNFITHGEWCEADIPTRFYNFAQVDLAKCW